MSGAERVRPLSGGLWTLLGWLRRDDHGSDSDSLSSGGSDRTTASFAFLQPHHYRLHAAPTVLPPPGPPTDSYRKRVRDRNIRRQHERDITLHRKYRLPLGEGSPGFDAFSLPSVRRSVSLAEARIERERRATSESLQRRAAYVPGKRRAPPPPAAPQPSPAGLRRRATKRPAPQPPHLRPNAQHNTLPRIKERENSIQMTSKPSAGEQKPLDNDKPAGCKSEKYIRKDSQTPKPRQEKGFLKQIFENRKRNSAIEPTTVKLLPSISELDRQAAELMQTFKLKAYDRDHDDPSLGTKNDGSSNYKGDAWFCTRCLKKYDSTMVTCLDCLSEAKVSTDSATYKDQCLALKNIYTQINVGTAAEPSSITKNDEKQKLKEMLKEMKDSLPKRPRAQKSETTEKIVMTFKEQPDDENKISKETPTLPMGATIQKDFKHDSQPSSSKQNPTVANTKDFKDDVHPAPGSSRATETVLVTQTIVLTDPGIKVTNNKSQNSKLIENPKPEINENVVADIVPSELTAMSGRNEPLKISSLLNPIYIPKTASNIPVTNFAAKKTFLGGTKPVTHDEASRSSAEVTKAKTSSLANTSAQKSLENKEYDQKPQDIEEYSPSSPKIRSRQPRVTNIKITSRLQTKGNTSSSTAATTNDSETGKTKNEPKPDTSTHEVLPSPISTPKRNVEQKPEIVKLRNENQSSSTPKLNVEQKPEIVILRNENQSTSTSRINVEQKPEIVILRNKDQSPYTSTPKLNVEQKPEIVKLRSENNSTRFTPSELLCKRRELISQLEKSIASGDERAASEAAIRLAQLKLSCSVLSFSSQIIAEDTPSTSAVADKLNLPTVENTTHEPVAKTTSSKVHSSTQSVGTKCVRVNLSTSNSTPSKVVATENSKTVITKETSSPKVAEVTPKAITTPLVVVVARPSTSQQELPKSVSNESGNAVPIEVWVEDTEAAHGPFNLSVSRQATLGVLRRQAEAALGIQATLQRWIVGRALCNDDNVALAALAGPALDAPFYLCLVESETKKTLGCGLTDNILKKTPEEKDGDVYSELVQLELRALVPNAEEFECGVCLEECEAGAGVILRDCVHAFCRDCLAASIRHCEEPTVACPATGCSGSLQEREIRSLVPPEEYERWLARGLAAAESGTRHSFHCRTRDCRGWALCEPGVQRFPCPVCRRTNCVPCQAIHEGETCEQHRVRLREAAAAAAATTTDQADEGTRALLDSLIARGEALECPECSAVITKKWGCDWVRCSACKTEICWVTRGRRWGPAGRGDTSAGCRCGLDGKRCHPSCGYCH